jgi:hypothetical protein
MFAKWAGVTKSAALSKRPVPKRRLTERPATWSAAPAAGAGRVVVGLLLIGLLPSSGVSRAQQPPPAGPAAPQAVAEDAVVATVEGDPIRYLDVKRQIVTALGGRPIAASAFPTVQAHTLEQIVYRRLLTAEFRRQGLQPTPAEEAQHDLNFAAELARQKISRDEYLRRSRLTEADLAEFRYWDVIWPKFVAREMTDQRLKAFYDAHRRDYDGTEVRTSHILIRPEGQGEKATAALCAAKAEQVRKEIVENKITFADAAKKYSDAPSREAGGDTGFITRRDRMVEEYSAAAFKLKQGEISPPVLTPFGVHLITVTDEKAGKKTLVDVRELIAPPVTAELFRETGRKLRDKAKVAYSGVIPHIDPVSQRVVP